MRWKRVRKARTSYWWVEGASWAAQAEVVSTSAGRRCRVSFMSFALQTVERRRRSD